MMTDLEVLNFLFVATRKAVRDTMGDTSDIGVERIVARGIGVSPGNYANWKARGVIPAEWVPKVWMLANNNGANLPTDWLTRACASEPKGGAPTSDDGPPRVIKPAQGIKRTPSGVRRPPKRPPPRKGTTRASAPA